MSLKRFPYQFMRGNAGIVFLCESWPAMECTKKAGMKTDIVKEFARSFSWRYPNDILLKTLKFRWKTNLSPFSRPFPPLSQPWLQE